MGGGGGDGGGGGGAVRCFELFGFDVLLDAALTPWLLEVNSQPGLGVGTRVDLEVDTQMLADLFELVVPREGGDGTFPAECGGFKLL